MLARLGELLHLVSFNKKEHLKGSYFNTCSQSTKIPNPNLQLFDSLQIGFFQSWVTVDYPNPSRSGRKRPFANKAPIHQHVCTHSLSSYAPLLRNRLYLCNEAFIKVPLQYHWNGKMLCITSPSGKLRYIPPWEKEHHLQRYLWEGRSISRIAAFWSFQLQFLQHWRVSGLRNSSCCWKKSA